MRKRVGKEGAPRKALLLLLAKVLEPFVVKQPGSSLPLNALDFTVALTSSRSGSSHPYATSDRSTSLGKSDLLQRLSIIVQYHPSSLRYKQFALQSLIPSAVYASA
jgi:hypothetical protein